MNLATPPTPTSDISTQKRLLQQRDKRLSERFKELYNGKRLRLDDVMERLEQEFFITQRTIRGILKNAPDEAAAPVQPGDQMDLFKS